MSLCIPASSCHLLTLTIRDSANTVNDKVYCLPSRKNGFHLTPWLHDVKALLLYSVSTSCYTSRMKIIAFLSQKGGSGKTTLAVHTAVAAQESGERAVVVDTDMQKSATAWKQAREGDTPALVTVAPAALSDVIKEI